MVAADCRTYRLIPHARHPDNVVMREVMRSALVGHSAERLYALINDVERYPEFLPWCVRAVVESRTDTEVVATLAISRGPLRTEFTTRNQLTPGREISMNLERGPFTSLTGAWTLTPIGESGCRVTLALRFEFSNAGHGRAVRTRVRADCGITGGCVRGTRQGRAWSGILNNGEDMIECEVICAWPGRSWVLPLTLPAGATVADALAQARAVSRRAAESSQVETSEIDWNAPVGVHGESCDRARQLEPGDRVELYRPLAIDPKESRRRRVAATSRSGRGGLRR
jgi:ribosome-associated toxin RatA of RatAB toxin-antitoxin module/putative ubiquitin-RnfH superfamily antitoxin RatB of RatAB toxin-antitoxin module